jgi:hypothetical protein
MVGLYAGIYRVAARLHRQAAQRHRSAAFLVSMAGRTVTHTVISISSHAHCHQQQQQFAASAAVSASEKATTTTMVTAVDHPSAAAASRRSDGGRDGSSGVTRYAAIVCLLDSVLPRVVAKTVALLPRSRTVIDALSTPNEERPTNNATGDESRRRARHHQWRRLPTRSHSSTSCDRLLSTSSGGEKPTATGCPSRKFYGSTTARVALKQPASGSGEATAPRCNVDEANSPVRPETTSLHLLPPPGDLRKHMSASEAVNSDPLRLSRIQFFDDDDGSAESSKGTKSNANSSERHDCHRRRLSECVEAVNKNAHVANTLTNCWPDDDSAVNERPLAAGSEAAVGGGVGTDAVPMDDRQKVPEVAFASALRRSYLYQSVDGEERFNDAARIETGDETDGKRSEPSDEAETKVEGCRELISVNAASWPPTRMKTIVPDADGAADGAATDAEGPADRITTVLPRPAADVDDMNKSAVADGERRNINQTPYNTVGCVSSSSRCATVISGNADSEDRRPSGGDTNTASLLTADVEPSSTGLQSSINLLTGLDSQQPISGVLKPPTAPTDNQTDYCNAVTTAENEPSASAGSDANAEEGDQTPESDVGSPLAKERSQRLVRAVRYDFRRDSRRRLLAKKHDDNARKTMPTICNDNCRSASLSTSGRQLQGQMLGRQFAPVVNGESINRSICDGDVRRRHSTHVSAGTEEEKPPRLLATEASTTADAGANTAARSQIRPQQPQQRNGIHSSGAQQQQKQPSNCQPTVGFQRKHVTLATDSGDDGVISKFRRKTDKPSATSAASGSDNRTRKALRTITVILGAFTVCWVPWHVLSLIIGFCHGAGSPATPLSAATTEIYNAGAIANDGLVVVTTDGSSIGGIGGNGGGGGGSSGDESCVSTLLYDISYWLCYLNSPLNPLCYALANPQFKRAFARIMRLDWHRS